MKLVRMIDEYINDRKFSLIYKDSKLDIINYSEVIDFSSTMITIRYKDTRYNIEGNNLVISKMMEEEILITGDIDRVTFL